MQRYINAEAILSISGPRFGQLFTDQDLKVLNEQVLIPNDPFIVKNKIIETHIFSFYGDYITGNHDASYAIFEPNTTSLLINIGKVFSEASINKGSYVVVNNIFNPLWGTFYDRPVIVKEISPDRTELKLVVEQSHLSKLSEFKNQLTNFTNDNVLNNVVINFGFNQIQKVVNFRVEENIIYLKLYRPIFDEVSELDNAFFVFEIIDPYVDSVILTTPLESGQTNQIPGPNYYLDTSQFTGESSIYKSWDDMLDSNLPTSQQIIDSTLSGSGFVKLNIDYTDFNNFVFYSSATERIENFYYKVGKLEEYSSSIAILNASTASNTTFISGSVSLNQRRMDQITTTFDPFEKWLYYAPTSSIFTHDVSGSITPYPKRLSNNTFVWHYSTSSIVTNWYNGVKETARQYDQSNMNRLYWAVPEHIIMDDGNSDFVLFIEMMGQHFDTLYSYVTALSQIHERDEHPERGFSNDLSFYIAKSFGWNLQNTRQTSDLWKYKLGTEKDGSFIQSGSYGIAPHELQSQQIWRRIVNNLPYLLKTKGTERSIKAMMSIYGIPQTLISIKEYGGPSIEANRPTLIEDRYFYSLVFSGSNWIELPRQAIPPTSGSWGGITRVPDTIDFRFNTTYSSSMSMSLWAIESPTRNSVYSNLELCHVGSKYSGSYSYGYLKFTVAENNSGTIISSSVQSDILPLYNGQNWNVSIICEESDDLFTFYDSDTSALSTLGSGSEYILSGANVYGYPKGVVKSTPIPTNVYDNDTQALIYQIPGTTYYLSSSNSYGITEYISKYIIESGSHPTFDNDSHAINSGVAAGESYALSVINSYAISAGIEKKLLNTNTLRLRVASVDDCGQGRIAFSSSMLWTGSYSLGSTWGSDLTGSINNYILIGGTTGSQSNRFSGSIQAYKEYFEPLSENAFFSHVLNPMAYHGNEPTSSYNTLFRYFPLGVDTQRWDHTTYISVSSSQPNRQASFHTTASFKGFTSGDENDWYKSQNETVYVYLPSLGGTVAKSNKIRYEESKLVRDLSPSVRSDVGKNDKSPFDTNRLAVVFSPTDQINNDIYNHTGFAELDDYIADPQYEFDEGYAELDRFGTSYFRKYQQQFDVNKFIRLFGVYDYSFFDQIRQLIPARADYIGGVMIEDDVLHRNKVRLTKLPEITNPQYEALYDLNFTTSSAENLTYQANITGSGELEFKYKYYTASLDPTFETEFKFKYLTASLGQATTLTGNLSTGSLIDIVSYPIGYSGSQSQTQSYIDHYKPNCCYQKVNYHYSSSGTFSTRYLRDWYTAVSKSYGWYYSRSLECTDYQYQESCATENYKRFYGTQLSGAGINIPSSTTVDGGPVVSIFISNESSIYYNDDPLNGNLKVE